MRSDLSLAVEAINADMNVISKSLMTLGETSAQMRACSASFMEIYNESKLAIYAAMLNRDKEEVLDCNNKAMQAYNNRDYFRCLYYMNRGGLSGDDFYRDVIGMCYHKGYAYVENILTAKSLKYISDEEINICAFVLDKFVPKGTKNGRCHIVCPYRCCSCNHGGDGIDVESVKT